jgi:hypothetical protein
LRTGKSAASPATATGFRAFVEKGGSPLACQVLLRAGPIPEDRDPQSGIPGYGLDEVVGVIVGTDEEGHEGGLVDLGASRLLLANSCSRANSTFWIRSCPPDSADPQLSSHRVGLMLFVIARSRIVSDDSQDDVPPIAGGLIERSSRCQPPLDPLKRRPSNARTRPRFNLSSQTQGLCAREGRRSDEVVVRPRSWKRRLRRGDVGGGRRPVPGTGYSTNSPRWGCREASSVTPSSTRKIRSAVRDPRTRTTRNWPMGQVVSMSTS